MAYVKRAHIFMNVSSNRDWLPFQKGNTQPTNACSKSAVETLEQGLS